MKIFWEMVALSLVVLALTLPTALLSMDREFLAEEKGTVVIRAYIAEAGGFKPNLIVVEKGQKVRLVVESMDVVHGFTIPSLDINTEPIDVGKRKVIEFMAEKEGIYFFGCSVRCSPYYFFMRGIIIVK